ncbi:ABC transporter permease [Methylosinus sp. Sm6]|uniref:ABC transporter permease n=1 Tax=Methylosinus sp. Sm6 TaxID=2866948 RepID=UPI001C991EF9|nr:ABC transporter permease [Methylosinus sp. Sm6]
MIVYLLQRLLSVAVVVYGAVTLIFLILFWLPGDPAELVAGPDADPATVATIRDRLGADKPLVEQYLGYVVRLAHADLGVSFTTGEPVFDRLAEQAPATFELTLAAGSLALASGIGLGVVSAVNAGRWGDYAIRSSLLLFASMPPFWLGVLLILLFSVTLRWLPAVGNGAAAQLVMPAFCLGLIAACPLARLVRANVLETLHEPFVVALRGKGLGERAVLYRHVLRNALAPAVTVFGVLTGEMLSGAVVVETVFARQGLGRLLAEAVGGKDIPMALGATLLAAVVFCIGNLLTDVVHRIIDPRIES